MRILILANIDMGLYKFRREFLEALLKEHDVFFCVPDGDFVEKIEILGAKHIPVNVLERRGTNPITDFRLLKFYQQILKEIKPDVVLTYTIKPNVYGGIACRKKKIPYISNITGLGTTIENGGVLAAISTMLYKTGLKKAQCVFFQNKDNQGLFINRGIVKNRSRLIPGSGVNLNMYTMEPYPNDNEGIRFLFVGRIMKDKGIEELLTVIEYIHSKRNDVTLDVVGFCDEDYNKALEGAQASGAIRYHGLQADVRPFYVACHCTVLPSYHEGMANVMLESSATGRPVITTRVPGCQETFDEGITGFGCEVRNIESLKEAMFKFISLSQDNRKDMGIAARSKMEREFDRNIVISAYKEEISMASRLLF